MNVKDLDWGWRGKSTTYYQAYTHTPTSTDPWRLLSCTESVTNSKWLFPRSLWLVSPWVQDSLSFFLSFLFVLLSILVQYFLKERWKSCRGGSWDSGRLCVCVCGGRRERRKSKLRVTHARSKPVFRLGRDLSFFLLHFGWYRKWIDVVVYKWGCRFDIQQRLFNARSGCEWRVERQRKCHTW
jgi:hypothetical protein